jgi:hypothetical protein
MQSERFFRLLIFVALALATTVPVDADKLPVESTAAEPPGANKFSASLNFDEASQYVWRGIQNDDQESLQPSLSLSYEISEDTTVELGGWWNLALDDHGTPFHEDLLYEENYTLSLSHALSDKLGIQVGYIYYGNPHAGRVPGFETYQTDEVFVGTSLSFGRFFFDATLYADIDKVDGFYLDLTQGLAWPLGERFTFEPSLHLGLSSGFAANSTVADEAFWYYDDGLVEGNITLRLSYALNEHFTIGLFGVYSQRFDDYEEATGEDESYSWFGLNLGMTL